MGLATRLSRRNTEPLTETATRWREELEDLWNQGNHEAAATCSGPDAAHRSEPAWLPMRGLPEGVGKFSFEWLKNLRVRERSSERVLTAAPGCCGLYRIACFGKAFHKIAIRSASMAMENQLVVEVHEAVSLSAGRHQFLGNGSVSCASL
jgi:hypothetical protein